MTEFMRNSDAFTWAMETDPRLRSTVVTVVLLDRSPDWDQIRQRFDLISRELPMFRQRVVESPPPAPPRWEYDADFDLDYHMRRVAVSGAGTLDDVLEMARVAAMQDFDRARALWEATLIEGLHDGAAAVICKFHHALTDGVGGIQIAMRLFDLSEEHYELESLPAAPEVPQPSRLEGYRDSWRYSALVAYQRGDRHGTAGTATGVRHYPAAHLDAPVGSGQRGVGLPDGPASQPHRFITDQGTRPDPAPRGARGAAAAIARCRAPVWRCAQRCVCRRGGRRVTHLSRKTRRRGWRFASDHADQLADKHR
ncbi:wax ester synthase-like Acyl-CoA acyltransferase domain protein [Mycobacterium kansasii 824]|nr:wax ester synthase-like Acyl-CoA acyltransferase domain protein [Mycobacterium kansasii 824]